MIDSRNARAGIAISYSIHITKWAFGNNSDYGDQGATSLMLTASLMNSSFYCAYSYLYLMMFMRRIDGKIVHYATTSIHTKFVRSRSTTRTKVWYYWMNKPAWGLTRSHSTVLSEIQNKHEQYIGRKTLSLVILALEFSFFQTTERIRMYEYRIPKKLKN